MSIENKNIKKFYQQSPKPFNYVPSDLVEGPPQQPPQMSGLMRINPDTGDIWISAGKSLVSDWRLITGGGGGSSITLQTNNVTNPDQTTLNLVNGSGMQIVDLGGGTIEFSTLATGKTVIPLTEDRPLTLTSDWIAFSGLALDVEQGYAYSFRIFCVYDIDDPAYGTRWAVNSGDASPITLAYYSYCSGSTQTSFIYNTVNTTYNEPANVSGTTFSATGNIAIIEGLFTPSQPDTLRITAVNDGGGGSATLTLKAGSYIEYIQTAV